jgi:hypothetical protein
MYVLIVGLCAGCESRTGDPVSKEISGYLEKESVLSKVEKDPERRSVIFHLKGRDGVGPLDFQKISSEEYEFNRTGVNSWLVSRKIDGKLVGVIHDHSEEGSQIIWVLGKPAE